MRLVHLRRAGERSIEAISPAMVRAGNEPAIAFAFEQRRAAVPAGIGEGADAVFAIAQNDERHTSKGQGEIIAGLPQPVCGADEVPNLVPDALHLAMVERWRGVAPN